MNGEHEAEFRFYAELNDLLAPKQRQRSLHYRFNGCPAVKDPIEVFGVPHTEVDAIVVNGHSVGFDYRLKSEDRVAVYPVFRCPEFSGLRCLREQYSTFPRFVLDVNLGKLAKRLRLLGFDSLYRNDYRDEEVAEIAETERRIVLTRDRRLLYYKRIEYGYWVRSVKVERQIEEVLNRFDLSESIRPCSRCLCCNGVLEPVEKAEIFDLLEPKTKLYYDIFYRCCGCRRIYWKGSHVENMQRRLNSFRIMLTDK